MKKLMTAFQHLLLKSRQRIETSFSVLQEDLWLVSSLCRLVWGHFARYLYACLARCLKQLQSLNPAASNFVIRVNYL